MGVGAAHWAEGGGLSIKAEFELVFPAGLGEIPVAAMGIGAASGWLAKKRAGRNETDHLLWPRLAGDDRRGNLEVRPGSVLACVGVRWGLRWGRSSRIHIERATLAETILPGPFHFRA